MVTFFALIGFVHSYTFAQQHFSYCNSIASPSPVVHLVSDVFPVPADLPSGGYSDEIKNAFISGTVNRVAHVSYAYCGIFGSRAEAEADKRQYKQGVLADPAYQLVETHWFWKYVPPTKRSTHSGGTKPTEAEALYDAENWSGPFEDNQYKTIHSWDTHDCTTKQVTGVAGSLKPTTFYQCTVTFSYSDTASPVAKTAFGKGDTQDAAIAAAKSSTVGVTWGQPFCSAFTVTVKNKYKADYGHSSGTKQQAWACEIDYTATK
jgi:hypothetical protein